MATRTVFREQYFPPLPVAFVGQGLLHHRHHCRTVGAGRTAEKLREPIVDLGIDGVAGEQVGATSPASIAMASSERPAENPPGMLIASSITRRTAGLAVGHAARIPSVTVIGSLPRSARRSTVTPSTSIGSARR
jgi:hypothetical protein